MGMSAPGDERTEEVPIATLAPGSRAGVVLRVPEKDGRPDWAAAVPDEEARRSGLSEAEDVLRRLRRRDPGGDDHVVADADSRLSRARSMSYNV